MYLSAQKVTNLTTQISSQNSVSKRNNDKALIQKQYNFEPAPIPPPTIQLFQFYLINHQLLEQIAIYVKLFRKIRCIFTRETDNFYSIIISKTALQNKLTCMARVAICLALMSILIDSANAQSFYARRRDRDLMLVAGSGTSTYLGELTNPGDYLDAEPNLVLGLQAFVTNRIGIRTEATWFRLSGSDAKSGSESRVPRNLSFFSNNLELSAVGIFNLFPHVGRYYQRPVINFYGFAGIAFLQFNPKTEYKGEVYSLQPLKTELVEYSRSAIAIPYGLGVRLKAGPFFNVSFEGGLRKTFTDYLDDVSTTHHDASKFSDPIALALSDRGVEIGYAKSVEGAVRGNPKTNDAYFLANIKLEYYLPVDFIFGNRLQNKRKTQLYRKRYKPSYRKRR